MKIFSCLLMFFLIISATQAQDSTYLKKLLDSLSTALKNTKEDTERVKILSLLANNTNDQKASVRFLHDGLILAQKIKFLKGEARIRTTLGNYYWNVSNYPASLENYLISLKICEQVNSKKGISANLGNLGNLYFSLGNYRKALDYSFQSGRIDKEFSIPDLGFELGTASKAYLQLNITDSALFFANEALSASEKSKSFFYITRSLEVLGDISFKKNDTKKALEYYRKALSYSKSILFDLGTSEIQQSLSELYYKNGQTDSAIYYSKEAIKVALPGKALPVVVSSANFLYKIYKHSDEHQSMYYLEMASATKDSIFNNQKNNELENIASAEESRQKDKEAAEIQYKNNLKLYGLIGVLAIIGIIAIIQMKNNSQKKKANLLLERQKQKVEITLTELKSTQAQLIQSEKMASLGELTAGIAHEIQNPLNFVNNFSEINKELIEEMQAELKSGNNNAAIATANNIKENEEKINHHGKRADAIVKGMLQHSRASSGTKEPTDINALTDEYFRLAYHGLRAKDKSFNATLKTDYDESIGNINIIPQDIGRVLLNLYTNAFYAVAEKKAAATLEYNPTVFVSTKKVINKIEIKVADNGNGIPQKVIDKIFQPFFTTKPTGQGTGLGLSLSYDIIKAHNGNIKLETKEGGGTTFIIQLPEM